MRTRSIIWTLGLITGVGVVVSQSTALTTRHHGTTPVQCRGSKAVEFGCYERLYTQLVRTQGPRAALRALAVEQTRNGYVRAACHQLTHRIGRAAGALRGISAFGDGRSVCASGYYHGVLQSVMAKMGARRAIENAATICAQLRTDDRYSAEHYNCVHGMGHGFMEVFASDVFESLDGCRSLHDPWENDECSGGVFMENVTAIDNRTRPSRYLRPGHPLYPCTELSRRYWDQCYDWQITYALYVTDSDFEKVFALCAAGERAARPPCYRGLGGDALQQSKFVTSGAARSVAIRRLCALGPGHEARTSCVTGAVRNMYRDYVDGAVQARALCRSLARARARELHPACLRAEARAKRTVALPQAGAG